MQNKKMAFLIKYSLKKKFKNKWFIGVNILLLLLFVCLANVDVIITSLGGDFSSNNNIIIVDNTNEFYKYFEYNMSLLDDNDTVDLEYTLKLDNELDVSDLKVDDLTKNDIVLVIDQSDDELLIAKMITNDTINSITYQILISMLNSSKIAYGLEQSGIDPNLFVNLSESLNVERVLLNEDSMSEDENIVASMALPVIVLPFFMLTIFLVQMIGAEVNEEKSTKSMEVILSNISAKTHFLSKVISGNIFVIGQGILLLLYTCIALATRLLLGANSIANGLGAEFSAITSSLASTGVIDKLWYIVPITLVLLVLSFIGYSLIAAILAAMTTNQEDFQQIQTPIMVISLIGYYLGIMASVFDGSVFIKICSYIPFISAILAPTLFLTGEFGMVDYLISVSLMVGVLYLLFKYGLRAYKVGILNYSSSKLWTKLYKSVKNKG